MKNTLNTSNTSNTSKTRVEFYTLSDCSDYVILDDDKVQAFVDSLKPCQYIRMYTENTSNILLPIDYSNVPCWEEEAPVPTICNRLNR